MRDKLEKIIKAYEEDENRRARKENREARK